LDERIFPMAEKSFSQVWADVLRRADIRNLHFHDLWREANTRFIKAGLTPEERNIMLRHADRSVNAVYVGRNTLLKEIQDKLDRVRVGRTHNARGRGTWHEDLGIVTFIGGRVPLCRFLGPGGLGALVVVCEPPAATT
jgi:hypothetical protein